MFGLGLGRLGAIANAIRAWNPLSLFANNEVGVWYDPSDFSTMFQDSTGTTPVTAVEQPVGLMLDKSKGLVLGPELVTNGGFDTDVTGWATGIGLSTTVVGGVARVSRTGLIDSNDAFTQTINVTPGKAYKITFIASNTTTIARDFSNTSPAISAAAVASGAISYTVTAISTFIKLNFWPADGETVYLDNISVKELPGQHSKQATAAARPVLRATPTRIDYDAVDDTLVATFASSLGTDCTICRAVPSVGASILTAQTIGTTYTDNTDHCGLIIVNRALTASETSSVTAYLNAKAGV